MTAVLALKPRHGLARRICDEMAETADDAEAGARLEAMVRSLAPGEVAATYAEMRRLSSKSRIARFERIAPLWHRLANRPPPDFRTCQLTSHATLYRRGGEGAGPGDAVLICFTDFVDQLFMPCLHFLMMIAEDDAPPVSVVVLRAAAPGAFCRGIPGLGGSLAEVVAALRVELAQSGLHRRAYMGASMGGFHALRAASLDDAAPGVSISGRFLRMGGDVRLRDVGAGHDPLMCRQAGDGANLHCVFGADEEVDADHAHRLRRLLPEAHLHPVPGCAEHNPLITLRARRKLRPFLRDLAKLAVSGGRAPVFAA